MLSTLIRKLDADSYSNVKQEESFLFDSTYTAGDKPVAGEAASFDLAKTGDDRAVYCRAGDMADANAVIPVGIVVSVKDDVAVIRTRGFITAEVDGSGVNIAAGDALTLGNGGHLVKHGAGDVVVAVALVASTANEAIEVFVCPSL